MLPFDSIKKTICIVITDFNLIENSEPKRYHHRYKLYDPADRTYFGDVEEVHVLELTRLPAVADGSKMWEWVTFIGAREESKLQMVKERNEEIGRAVEELYRVSSDDRVRFQYEMREKAWRDEQARLDHSIKEGRRQGLQQGRKEGVQEGLQQGRREGIQEGIEKGMQQGFFKTAVQLKKMGLSVEQIAEATGLSPEQIAGL